MIIKDKIDHIRAGLEPSTVCRVPSGWVVLAHTQYLPGYSILLPDPVVPSLNNLNLAQRLAFLCDMAMVGDALLEITGAYRINYAIFGNSDPVLHAHIIPRFLSEPDALRKGPPWYYKQESSDQRVFDPVKDCELVQQLKNAILKRL